MRILPFLFLLPILFCYMCLCSHVFMVCIEDQQSLLLQLKNTLKFNSTWSSKLVSWNQSLPCCDWSGVTCDKEGHVIGLNLSSESIGEELDNSSALFSFQYLQILDLSYNYFNSSIPPAIQNLKNLTSLNLSFNSFSGLNNSNALFSLQYLQNLDLRGNYFNSSIPIAIKNLKNLTSLDLSYNQFEGQIPMEISQLTRLVTLGLSSSSSLKLENPNLQKLVQNLTKIRQLHLDHVNISAQGQEWSNALLAMPGLEELSMINCNLLGPIDSSLIRLENLSQIYLDYNNLSSIVPESFANFKNLIALGLRNCSLRGIFPQKIFQIATLSFIDLSYNHNLHGSLPDFPLNGSLKILAMHGTKIHGVLPNSINNLMHLFILDLPYNNFIGPIPSFDALKNLVAVDLSHNFFNGSIPSSLFALPFLEYVQLSFNHFDGEIKLDMLQSLQRLIVLDFSYNNLSIDANAVDADLSSFPKLFSLRLASCNLREFPMLLRNQSRMIFELDLSNNHIQGLIPHWIWKLKLGNLNLSINSLTGFEGSVPNLTIELDVLDLHSNKLQGQIPVFPTLRFLDYSSNNFNSVIPYNIGTNLYSCQFLSLSKNKFHGRIPYSLCNPSYLRGLDLSDNRLEGTIPACLMQSETLQVLNLGSNMLNGNIPDAFPKSCAVKTLDIHENQLGGLIPKSLANCVELEVLDLGYNHINGHFPCLLKEISTLRVMVLRKNKFHGSIRCLDTNCTWSVLQIVDLAFNNFSGLLPAKAFTTWEAMMHVEDQSVLDFGYIQEPIIVFIDWSVIPTSDRINMVQKSYQDSVTIMSKGLEMKFIKIINILHSIDFSSNNFEGPIPRELMNLKGLHILNLSHNAFSSQIPSSIDNLKLLESLDLSINYLTGKIPTQLASLTFLAFLNLSYNHLVGKIPTGTQLQSFEASSFLGNDGLYGPPLTKSPNDRKQGLLPPPAFENHHLVDFNFITGAELGVIFGLGIIIGPLFFNKKWRIRYWKHVDNILCRVFPQLYLEYQRHEGQMYTVLRWRH